MKTGEPMISPDIATETRFSYPPFLIENGVRAVANVVILGGQDRPAFGILQIDSRKPRHFNSRDTGFLRSYANLLAAAVDRLRVIDEVRDGEERLRLALEAGELGSWELDLASGTTIRTSRHNKIFGYAEHLPPWTYDLFLDHVVVEDRERVARTFRQAVDSKTEWHIECRIRRADDNEVRWIELRGQRLGRRSNAAPDNMLGIVADITARKAADEALHKSHEMLEAKVAERTRELIASHDKLRIAAEERERVEQILRQSQKMEAVGQLTGGLAHDFNNLLAAISGSLELIALRASQGRTADLARYIEAAQASAARAATLTARLLAFASRQTLDPRPININQLVGGLEDLFRRTVGPMITVATELADDLWPTLCDPNQLETALLNLVINARDAMPDSGALVIKSANAALPDRRGAAGDVLLIDVPPGDYVALHVADTGTGMGPDVMARAFDPFFTTKPIGQGTGLGLSMVYGFVQQSGGQVLLRSDEGQGTTVTIYLPRHVGPVEGGGAGHATVSLPEAATSAVLLVVEDEPPIRMIIVDVLSELGHTVLEAGDGRSGLDIVKSNTRLDLLVTDVGLPGGMNGRQLADAARQLRPGLKVLFVTGYAAGALVDGILDQGMQVLTKPFAMAALADRVQAMLDLP